MGTSLTACSGQNEAQEVNRVSVSGIFPETGNVVVTNTYIGTVEPKESITVYPMKSGNITEVNAQVGAQVKKGDILFKIDSKATDLEIADAEEELEKAEKLAEQAEKDAKELEEALAKVEVAEEKADLEVQIEEKKEKVDKYKKNYEDAKEDYDDLNKDYNKYNYKNGTVSSDNRWSKEESEARQDELSMAKKYMDLQKSIYDTENSELTALEKALSNASKSTGSSTTNKSSSTTTKTSSSSNTTNSKTSEDKKSDDKDSDDKSSVNKTTDTVTVNTTVYDQMVEDAKQKVEDAKAKLELYQISAPIDGTIEAVYIEKNEKAFEDTPCLVLSNKSNMEVTFQVAEAAAYVLKTGDKIRVEKNGAMNEATITEISLMADPQTKLFQVKASLGSVTGFSTGTDVKVYAETQKVSNVMILPYDTLYFHGDTAYVYCAEDDEAVRKTVQIGLMNEEYAQILDGLEEEDIVISTWSSQLKDGADIDLLFVIGGKTVEVPIDGEEGTESGLEGIEEPTGEDTEIDSSEETEEEYKWVLPDMD